MKSKIFLSINEDLNVTEDEEEEVLLIGDQSSMNPDIDACSDEGCGTQLIQTSPAKKGRRALTLQNAIDEVGYGKFQVFMALVCGVTWALDACQALSLSLIAPEIKDDFDLNSLKEVLLVLICFLGMATSSPVWGAVCDRFGRKIGLLATPAFGITGAVIAALSHSIWLIFVGQFVIGIGIGAAPVAFNMFSEMIPSKKRGFVLIAFELFWSIGSIYEVILCWIIIPRYGWRVLVLVSCVPMVILLVVFYWVPESPRFLLVTGNRRKSKRVIRRICRMNGKEIEKFRLIVAVSEDDGEIKSDEKVKFADVAENRGDSVLQDVLVASSYNESDEGDHGEISSGLDESGVNIQHDGQEESECDIDEGIATRSEVYDVDALDREEDSDDNDDGDDDDDEEDNTRAMSANFEEESEKDLESRAIVDENNDYDHSLSVFGAIPVIFGRRFGVTTVLLGFLWFFNTFVYYGLIFFTPLFFSGGSKDDSSSSSSSSSDSSHSSAMYVLTLITTCGEIPGLIVAMFCIEILGRKRTQALFFFSCFCATMLLNLIEVGLTKYVLGFFALWSRASIIGAFDTTYCYSPEVYPTSVRSSALGLFAALSRVAGMLSPSLPYFVPKSIPYVPVTIFAIICLIASVLSCCLPIETSGKQLADVSSKKKK